jgi:hypothetical protein
MEVMTKGARGKGQLKGQGCFCGLGTSSGAVFSIFT